MYEAYLLFDKIGEFETFEGAFRALHAKITEEIKTGITAGALIPTTWIMKDGQYIDGINDNNWDNMIDLAKAKGILDQNGKLITKATAVTIRKIPIEKCFRGSTDKFHYC